MKLCEVLRKSETGDNVFRIKQYPFELGVMNCIGVILIN